ncbi:MAG: hypothetical protein H7Y43_11780 [Akkermansiaceae bacterium]|nr:hypothetical protein [Verrucomicrobiales bacterium]
MSDPQPLRETNWRRPLTPAEAVELRSNLKGNPPDLERENALTEALNGLRDVPVSSNFTARVLQAVDAEKAAALRRRAGKNFSWRSLIPKFAIGATALCVGVLLVQQHRVEQRIERARSVATMSEVAPDPAVLKDFNAISAMSQPSVPPDEGLLAMESLLAQLQ